MTDPNLRRRSEQADDACDCCEINDYDGQDLGPCENCGHSIEEHG